MFRIAHRDPGPDCGRVVDRGAQSAPPPPPARPPDPPPVYEPTHHAPEISTPLTEGDESPGKRPVTTRAHLRRITDQASARGPPACATATTRRQPLRAAATMSGRLGRRRSAPGGVARARSGLPPSHGPPAPSLAACRGRRATVRAPWRAPRRPPVARSGR